MSDHFEKAKSDILARTKDNGGPTPFDLLEALEATNDDFDDQMERNHSDHGEIICRLDDHIKKERATLSLIDRQIVDLKTMGARGESPELSDLMLSWKRLKWFLIVVIGAVVIMLADQLGNMIFGGAT